LQVFKAEQVPFPLQTIESVGFDKKQVNVSQFVPKYPILQLHKFGDVQLPLPLQTEVSFEITPSQIIFWHFSWTYPILHEQ
jgi:hypothetical protein